MTEDRDLQDALRRTVAERVATLTTPTHVYEDVRRRHRRGRATTIGVTVVAVLLAVAVPALVLQNRQSPAPAATVPPAPGVAVGGGPAVCRNFDPTEGKGISVAGLPAQHGVRGSLGNDPAAVTAVMRTVWRSIGRSLGSVPAATQVHSVERVDGAVVGTVTVTDAGRHTMSQGTAVGPDIAHLHAEGGEGGSGGLDIPDPITTTFFGSDVNVEVVTVGCGQFLSVVAPPGASATVDWITGVGADGKLQRGGPRDLLRPDGVGLVGMPAGLLALSVKVVKDGRVLYQQPQQIAPLGPSPELIDRLAKQAPGPGNHFVAAGVLKTFTVQAAWPRGYLKVLWAGAYGRETTTVAVLTLPSGAQVVWGGVSQSATSIPGGARAFAGILPAGALDRSALLYRMPLPGHPLALFVSGTKQITYVRSGTSQTLEVTDGVVLQDGDSISSVTVGPDPVLDVGRLNPLPPLLGQG